MAYCFAWDQNAMGKWGCKATTIDCDGKDESCPFFKTLEKNLADRAAANERIATLPEWQQTAISEKHYGGDMPWRKRDKSGVSDAASEESPVPTM